jgi:RNA polymerase sigma-70 factor, ECF subfamily
MFRWSASGSPSGRACVFLDRKDHLPDILHKPVSQASLPIAIAHASEPAEAADEAPSPSRLRDVVVQEHAFVWRSLRRLGVAEGDVDDAVQKVFLVAARRLGPVEAGRERGFLFATAMRVASNERRGTARRRSAGAEPLDGLTAEGRSPESIAHDRALLDRLLEPLPLELRSALVLFELEQLTVDEIGELLDIPVGTVASRIRRAREMVVGVRKRMDALKGGLSRGEVP